MLMIILETWAGLYILNRFFSIAEQASVAAYKEKSKKK